MILSIETLRVPNVPEPERVSIDDLGYRDDGISHVAARLGFQDRIDVPRLLAQAVEQGLEGDCDVDTASYFLSRMTIVPTDAPTMRRWRKKLFMARRPQRRQSGHLLRAARRAHGRHGLARHLLVVVGPFPVVGVAVLRIGEVGLELGRERVAQRVAVPVAVGGVLDQVALGLLPAVLLAAARLVGGLERGIVGVVEDRAADAARLKAAADSSSATSSASGSRAPVCSASGFVASANSRAPCPTRAGAAAVPRGRGSRWEARVRSWLRPILRARR